MVILKYKKSGIVLKLWHVNANSVDVMRLNILSEGLLDPIGTSRVKHLLHPLLLNTKIYCTQGRNITRGRRLRGNFHRGCNKSCIH